MNSFCGGSGQKLQVSGFLGLQTYPGLHPNVNLDLGRYVDARVAVGAGQRVTEVMVVTVNVLGGTVTVTGGIVMVVGT